MFDIGILGGGQLARMMIYRSAHLGLRFAVLDPDPECSASGICTNLVIGSLKDPEATRRLARECRLLTFDIEHLNVEELLALEADGVIVRPSPRVLQIVQDKLRQKRHLERHGIPQPRFWESDPGLRPAVCKTRQGGYDGRGVEILRETKQVGSLSGETYWEEYADPAMELAVLGAVGVGGESVFFPPVEMIFDPVLNICDEIVQPARVAPEIAREAVAIARTVLESFIPLGLVGVMAVEMFVTPQGRILVNEVAPRPHNSGHATMEIASLCQFEAHVRAVSGLPLSEPHIVGAAWMKNLLGIGHGRPQLRGQSVLVRPEYRIHLYGKAECRDGRKMGHLTVVAPTPDEAIRLSSAVREVRVEGVRDS